MVLGLAVGVIGWLVVEVAFALHGWPAVPRYIFEPAVVAIVLGGIAFGWLLREIPARLRLPTWSGIGVAALLALALVPGALSRDAPRAQGHPPRARCAPSRSTSCRS